MAALRVASLFSGIGGIDLGLERAGHKVELLCDSDPSARRVLESKFDTNSVHTDVTKLRSLPAHTDIVTAGFPCQDISQAGLVRGLRGQHSKLVSEVFRLALKNKPEFILLENVAFLLRAKQGRILNEIVTTLEQLGYWWAYRTIDSQHFGVPQRRERVFLLASRSHDPRTILHSGDYAPQPASADPKTPIGFYWSEGNSGFGWARNAIPPLKSGSRAGGAIPPAILRCSGEIIKPDIRDAERLQGFPANWTVEALSNRERWRLVGNAVTVPVAEWLGNQLNRPSEDIRDGRRLSSGDTWPRAAYNVSGYRYGVEFEGAPVKPRQANLETFLRHDGTHLSVRATEGFLSRARRSSIATPTGFLNRVAGHLKEQRKRERLQ